MDEFVNDVVQSESVLSVRDAAERIGEPQWRVYGWIRRKNGLRVQRQGRRIYIADADLQAFMLGRKKMPGPGDQGQESGDARSLPVTEPAIAADGGAQEKQSVTPPVVNESYGQQELRHQPRMLGSRGYLCVPQWKI